MVDLLYLEGLYSKNQRKSLHKELGAVSDFVGEYKKETRAFYSFLNYMGGLAYAKMGEAARAYTRITREAENYMEVQARKSSLQDIGTTPT